MTIIQNVVRTEIQMTPDEVQLLREFLTVFGTCRLIFEQNDAGIPGAAPYRVHAFTPAPPGIIHVVGAGINFEEALRGAVREALLHWEAAPLLPGKDG